MKFGYCGPAAKPCRTKEDATTRAQNATEYRRAYKCEFCPWWHITSRPRREDMVIEVEEPQELDVD